MRHTIAMHPDHTGAIPTASSATIEQYTKAGQSLLHQCARYLGVKVPTLGLAQFIDWFVRQHGRWSNNTIRVYRRAAETYLHAMWARQLLSPDELCRLLATVYPGPRPRQSAQRGTAAAKAYVTTEDEVRTVAEAAHLAAHLAADPDAPIIELLCKFAPDFGLRPGEWAAASIHGDLFIAPNSKHSNGRANGPYRAILIDTMPLPDRHELSELCRLLSDAVKSAGKCKKGQSALGESFGAGLSGEQTSQTLFVRIPGHCLRPIQGRRTYPRRNRRADGARCRYDEFHALPARTTGTQVLAPEDRLPATSQMRRHGPRSIS